MKNGGSAGTAIDIYERTDSFSLGLVRLTRKIPLDNTNRPLVSQLVRAGTSISANLHEANLGSSRKDFVNKVAIALRESAETLYWLRLLRDSDYLSPELANSHIQEAYEITNILAKIKINAQTHT